LGDHIGSVRAADRQLAALMRPESVDTTHFDTVRFPPPDWARAAFDEAVRDGRNAYTAYRGHPDVLTTLAGSIGAFLGVNLGAAENLILAPGTQAALFTALSSTVLEGQDVVLFNPDYLFTERIVKFLGGNVQRVQLVEDISSDVSPNLDALEQVFERGARTLVFSHPNNPTGVVFKQDVIAKMARLCRQFDVMVIVDELYSRLVFEGRHFQHFVAEPGMESRTVTLLGPSKTESMSGYRLGVAVGPKDIVERMEDVLAATSLRAPAYAQHLLKRWLVDDNDWLAERMKAFQNLRDMTVQYLSELDWLELRPGGGTAYAWPNVGELGLGSYEVSSALLTGADVLVSPGYQFGPGNDARFRVCYARDEEEWRSALRRMVRVLRGLETQRRGVVGHGL